MNYIVGDSEELEKTISEKDILLFSDVSGDYNPVHVSREEAKKSIFGKQIAHGMLIGGYISNVIGMKFPGPGTIYIEQLLKFESPVFLNDTVKVVVKIEEIINRTKGILKLSTRVFNQNDDVVVDGYAVVKAPIGDKDE